MLGGWVNPHSGQQTIPQGQTSIPPKSFSTPTANGQSAPRSGSARGVGRRGEPHTEHGLGEVCDLPRRIYDATAEGGLTRPTTVSQSNARWLTLAFTRYCFTSRRMCTNQSSLHCPLSPVLPALLQYYCATIAQYTTSFRPLFCACHTPYSICGDNIVWRPRPTTSHIWCYGRRYIL